MKIVYFTDAFLPQINGVFTSVVNFSKEMAKKGHTVYIYTTSLKNHNRPTTLGKRIHVVSFSSTTKLINYPDFPLAYPHMLKTLRMLRKIRPDIIHTNAPSPHGWTALFCARVLNIPIISTYHT